MNLFFVKLVTQIQRKAVFIAAVNTTTLIPVWIRFCMNTIIVTNLLFTLTMIMITNILSFKPR